MTVRILFSIPSQSHVQIALDEKEGMEDLGNICGQFEYAARDGYGSVAARLFIIFKNAFNLVRLSAAFRPDIIYLNSRLEVKAGFRDFITILLVKYLYAVKVRFIIKSHGSDIPVLTDKGFLIRNIIMPFLKRHVDAWLFLSREEKRAIDLIGFFDSNKVFVTKNIVRHTQFKPDPGFKKKWNVPEGRPLLLFTGRVIREKGVFEVVEAFAKFKDLHQAFLIIVGSGEEYSELYALCESLKLSDKVLFTGFIPEKDVVEFYANCDILVFPTYFPEGFPMTLFNSVAAGMCILTTPTRAALDYLSDPQNCLWIEPKNASSVLNGLVRLHNNKSLYAEMKANNKVLGKDFSREEVCKELDEIIKIHL
jgi:glycosyltransferase involved in cell wall biosynthesis